MDGTITLFLLRMVFYYLLILLRKAQLDLDYSKCHTLFAQMSDNHCTVVLALFAPNAATVVTMSCREVFLKAFSIRTHF